MMSFQNKIRINKEYQELQHYCPEGLTCALYDGNIQHWWAVIDGPKNTPYEGGAFKLDILIPNDYPYKPPKVVFKTKIFHPNINKEGKISIDYLQDEWTMALSIPKVILSIQSFLDDPNPDDPLVPEIAYIYKNDKKSTNKWLRNILKNMRRERLQK